MQMWKGLEGERATVARMVVALEVLECGDILKKIRQIGATHTPTSRRKAAFPHAKASPGQVNIAHRKLVAPDPGGWSQVRKADGKSGAVPTSYLGNSYGTINFNSEFLGDPEKMEKAQKSNQNLAGGQSRN